MEGLNGGGGGGGGISKSKMGGGGGGIEEREGNRGGCEERGRGPRMRSPNGSLDGRFMRPPSRG